MKLIARMLKLFFFFPILIFLLFFLHKNVWSQDIPKGVIIVHVAPQKAIIYLDSIKQENHDQKQVAEGKHVLKIWAPGRQLVNDTVSITKDSTLVYIKILLYRDEYSQYLKKKSGYILARTVPPALTLISTVVLATSYSHSKKMMDKNYEDAKQSEQNFYSTFAITSLDQSKASFNQSKESYEKYRKKTNALVIAGAITIPLGIGTSVYFFLRSKKSHYQEAPLLTRVNGNFFLTGNGGAGVSLSCKF